MPADRVEELQQKGGLEVSEVQGADLGGILLNCESEGVGDGGAPQQILGGYFPLVVQKLVESHLLLHNHYIDDRKEEGVDE